MQVREFASILFEHFLDILFPPVCDNCGRLLASGKEFPICSNCLDTLFVLESPLCPRCGLPNVFIQNECPDCAVLPPPEQSFSVAVAVSPYRGLAKELILALKFKGRTYLAPRIAKLMAETAKIVIDGSNEPILVPSPMHKLEYFLKGYNHAELIAIELGKFLNLPVWVDVLKKVRYTKRQAGLSRQERLINLNNAFKVQSSKAHQIVGRTVVFIDDVLTTGATAAAAARALKAAGARDVKVLTLCRSTI